jgi:hypothetical protein
MTVALRLSRPTECAACLSAALRSHRVAASQHHQIGILQNGAIARRLVVALGERALALRSVQRLLETIADEHGVADCSQYRQVR